MDEITLIDYWRILKQRKKSLFGVVLATLSAAGIYLMLTPRVYQSEATLLFPRQPDGGLSIQLGQASGIQLPGSLTALSGKDIYVSVLKSRTLSESVLSRMGLSRYGIRCGDLMSHLSVLTNREGGLTVGCQVPATWLKGHVPNNELPEKTARLSADLTNTFISELRSYDRSNVLFTSKKHRLYIGKQLEITKDQLSEAERRLESFQANHPTLVPPDKSSIYAEQIVDISAKESEAAIALREAEQKASSVRAMWTAGAPRGIAPEALINNSTIETLRGELAKLEVKQAVMLEDLTDNHPDVVSAGQEIDKTRNRIRTEINRVVNGVSSSLDPARQEMLKELVMAEVTRDSLKARHDAFVTSVKKLEQSASGLPPKQIEYVRLLRELKSVESVYTTLLAEEAKARVAEGKDADNFMVLDYATVPEGPAQPKPKMVLLSALIIGMMLGVLTVSIQGPRAPRKTFGG